MTIQRGYYAPSFSPEAQEAEAARAFQGDDFQRPADWRPHGQR